MPLVEESIDVGAQARQVYEVVRDVERFPEFMEDVHEVSILERGDDWAVSMWVNVIDGRRIEWIEKDVHDEEGLRIDFSLVKGDLKDYYGHWLLTPGSDGESTRVDFSIYFEFGIPMLAGLLHPLLARKLRANMQQMLDAVRLRFES